jgi:hypothetical protein
MRYHRVSAADSQTRSHSRRNDLSFEAVAGARVVPIRSCSSGGVQKVGSVSKGSALT